MLLRIVFSQQSPIMRGPLENELKTKNNQKQQSVLQFPILQQVQQDLQKLKEKNLQLKRK